MTLHRHHRKRRSQGGDDSEANILLVTPEQHDWIHRNPALARELGWLVQSWEDPEEVEVVMSPEKVLELERDARDGRDSGDEVGTRSGRGRVNVYERDGIRVYEPLPPKPGEPCPACERRVPFPKTEKTPPTKKKAYWVPADEHEAHEDVLETAAKHLGTFERPFWEFATVTLALALVLQDESLRGFAHRSPHHREYEVPDRAEPETQGLA